MGLIPRTSRIECRPCFRGGNARASRMIRSYIPFTSWGMYEVPNVQPRLETGVM